MLHIEKKDGYIYLIVDGQAVWCGTIEDWSRVIATPLTRDTPKAA